MPPSSVSTICTLRYDASASKFRGSNTSPRSSWYTAISSAITLISVNMPNVSWGVNQKTTKQNYSQGENRTRRDIDGVRVCRQLHDLCNTEAFEKGGRGFEAPTPTPSANIDWVRGVLNLHQSCSKKGRCALVASFFVQFPVFLTGRKSSPILESNFAIWTIYGINH